MKVTEVLFKHHIGRMIQRHWYIQGKVKVRNTTTEDILKSRGHEVIDVLEFLRPPQKKEKIDIVGFYDREPQKDENHPDYNLEPCFIYNDKDLLIEGLEQAKVLTNTVEVSKGLPERFIEEENKLNLSDEVHVEIVKGIKLSCMFEATQEKLPKKKDPNRPTWVFPRDYGIPSVKKSDLICKNLEKICEQYGQNIRNKSVILDAFFSCPIEAHNKKIQFELSSELLVTRGSNLKVLAEPSLTYSTSLPNLYPLDCTASLIPYHFYKMQNIYSPGINSKWPYIQTAFIYLDPTQIQNIIEEEVTEEQIHGRSLLKGFCMAAAQAHAMFGSETKKIPEPIVVPVVQTDGKMFHFTVFQLNTLELDKSSEVKNIFWNSPRIPLYSVCEYRVGRPVLEEYNPDIIRKLLSFYNIE